MPKLPTIIGILILSLLLIGTGYVALQSTLEETVFIPEYARIKCEECAQKVNINYLMERKSGIISTLRASFFCNGNFDKGDNVNIVQNGEKKLNYNYYPAGCSLTVTGDARVYKCKPNTDECDELKRQKISQTNEDHPITVQLQSPKDRLFISSSGDVTIIGTSQPYCLKLIEANNREDVIRGCTTADLVGRFGVSDFNILLKDAKEQNINLNTPIGVLDEVEHIITGAKSVPKNEQINIITHPKTKKQIYIFSLDGTYYPIEEAKGGILYADVSNPQKDETIICRPSSPNCDQTGTKIAPLDKSGQECGLFKNIPEGLVRISATEKCSFKCSEGKLEQDECEVIKEEDINCPSGTIVLGNQCVQNNEGSAAIACNQGGGKWVVEKTPSCGLACQIGLKEPTIIENSYCDDSGFFGGNLPMFSILFGFLTSLISFLFLFNKFGKNPTNITISALISVVAGLIVGFIWYNYGTAITVVTILVLITLGVLFVLFGKFKGVLK